VSDVVTISDEARGPLSTIEDRATRRELGKLWTTLEGRMPAAGKVAEPHTLVTHADITRTEAALSKRIEAIELQARQTNVVQGGGGAAGSNLLARNNVWTGTNEYRGNVLLRRLATGAISVNPVTIMLEDNYSGSLDIQRTTDIASGEAVLTAGASALFVQHRAQGTHAGGAATAEIRGISSHVETTQSASASYLNTACAGYFAVHNMGTECSAQGVQVDAYHRANGNGPNTVGVSVRLYGSTYGQTGKVAGVAIVASGLAPYDRRIDFGFLVHPDGSPASNVHYPFSAGSDWGAGTLTCRVAFDAAHARPSLAAVRIRSGDAIIFDGPDRNAWSMLHHDSPIMGHAVSIGRGVGDSFQRRFMFMDNGDFAITSGTLSIWNPRGRAPVPSLPSAEEQDGLKHFGYFGVVLGGFTRYVPFYGIFT
jgi:hypothetical protein